MRMARWLATGLTAALIGVGGALGAADAQTSKLRIQASFPPTSLAMDGFRIWADRVKAMSAGKIDMEGLAAGTVLPAFEVLDGVHKGAVDGGYSASAYWVGKHRAAGLFGATPGGPYGMDEMDFYGWLHMGGGLELYHELYQKELKRDVHVIPVAWVGNQVFGWYAKPIKDWADLRGRKCRQTGIFAELIAKSGMAVVNMPGGEIVPAAERGLIECAEWASPADDMKIGFHTVWKHYYMPSVHEISPILEILFNLASWNKTPPEHQQIMKTAAWEASVTQRLMTNLLNYDAMQELTTKHGVTIHRTPDDILKKILEVWDQMVADESAKNPFFKKVTESQKAYAAKVVPLRGKVYPDYSFTRDHYWPAKK